MSDRGNVFGEKSGIFNSEGETYWLLENKGLYIDACGFLLSVWNAFETMMKCAFSNQTNRIVDVYFYHGSMSSFSKV